MKKLLVILVNILIVAVIIAFVMIYTRNEQRQALVAQTAAFESMTVAMEHVTTNYLIGEQRLCESWANYINANEMTGEEAIAYVRTCVTSPNVMAHILYTDQSVLLGFSTVDSAQSGPRVSYDEINIFGGDAETFFAADNSVYVTRTYTNPVNALQSIAFCRPLVLKDEADGSTRRAALLRIIPVSSFEKEWTFPTDDYENAEIALLDAQGNYIIKGRSFKNTNFLEFYKSYNDNSIQAQQALRNALNSETGWFEMKNSRGEDAIVSHTRVNSTDNWVLLALTPLSDLNRTSMDWRLVGIVTAGLLALLIFDFIMMLRFNSRFRQTADEAEKANRAKTEFLSTMSHDIRTPMNAIIGLTAIARKNADDPDVVRDNLHKIALASNHLLTLINDILDISKVESGKLNLSPVTFSIVECADNLVNISQPMIKEKNIDFNFRVNRFDKEHLYADQLRLNQIFINLLSNAIKYTEPGGKVCVDLKQTPGSTDKTIGLVYTVQDTGIGMTPEFMTRMYQPFSRQTDSRVNTVQGTGLGLAITKQMIDLMHGTIDCESVLDKGTRFTVTLELPIAEKPEAELRLPPTKVLVVDDDEVLLETAKDTLISIGAQTDTAQSGYEAIKMAEEAKAGEKPYQAVILDWKMRDMDGIETARRLRERVGREIPILLISAYEWADLEQKAREAGVNGFVSKPLFRSTLYDKLSELLGGVQENREQEEETSNIAGMHILVAEDNDINWEIISELLKMHSVSCERAENGLKAVQRMQNAKPGEFGLIFMDIQMPVMNGIEATKAIRALEDREAASIPIIAMTADAFSENVAECMAAGMNGHIPKPVDMKLVLKEITRVKESLLKAQK